MDTILTDKIMDEMKCNGCHKYLSILPIKVYTTRQILCGRCNKGDDSGRPSLSELLLKNVRFRCVNRYDGCNVLVMPDEMKEHEEKCPSETFDCPICKGFSATSYDMLHHLRTEHSLKSFDGLMVVDFDKHSGENYYLHLNGDLIVVVYINIDKILKQLSIAVVNIGPEKRARLVKNQITLYDVDQIIVKSTKKRCTNFIDNESSFHFNLDEVTAKTKIITVKLYLDTSLVDNCYQVYQKPLKLNFTAPLKDSGANAPTFEFPFNIEKPKNLYSFEEAAKEAPTSAKFGLFGDSRAASKGNNRILHHAKRRII